MTTLHFHLKPEEVPVPTAGGEMHVYLYGGTPVHSGTGCIGNQAKDEVTRLGVAPRRIVIDLLSIALAVTAADTFVLRDDADNSWARKLHLIVPLANPGPWTTVVGQLEQTLRFLTGDEWTFEFTGGGRPPPTQLEVNSRMRGVDLSQIDRVSLFSGGLDSGIATWRMLSDGVRPLLVSHAYNGDASYQDSVVGLLPSRPQRFLINASPERHGVHDISMRSRSFNFLALAAVAADTLSTIRGGASTDVWVPENGLIALNAPLTPRRIGALSTRTTHPHYLSGLQKIFDQVGISARIQNPYEAMTKGEMVALIASEPDVEKFASSTLSCGNWRRANQQCGRCVPCLIRRAALYAGGVDDLTEYGCPNLPDVMSSEDNRDDLVSMMTAVGRLRTNNHALWVAQSGPLPTEPERRQRLLDVHRRGLQEVANFLRDSGLRVD